MLNWYLLWTASSLMQIIILWRGVRCHMIRTYRLFYFYVGFVLLSSTVDAFFAAGAGFQSQAYYYSYNASALLIPALRALLLWDLYRRVSPFVKFGSKDRRWGYVLGLGTVVPISLGLTRHSEIDVFVEFQTVVTPFLVVAFILMCRLALRVRDTACLGRNLTGILAGTGLLILGDAVNYERFLSDYSYSLYAFLSQFTNFAAFGIWMYDCWEFSPLQVRRQAREAGHLVVR